MLGDCVSNYYRAAPMAVPIALTDPPEWHRDALCQEYPAGWFFTERGENELVDAAKAVCRRCLVRRECLTFALNDPDALHHGIWGATSARERREIAQRRRRAA